jgi:hypothetical protein
MSSAKSSDQRCKRRQRVHAPDPLKFTDDRIDVVGHLN